MARGAKLLGYWIVVRDEDSARYAIRMAGLPMLIMGANVGLLALTMATQVQPNANLIISLLLLSVLLVILAFRIRSGGSAWVPFAALLFCSFFAFNIAASVMALRQGDETMFQGTRIVVSWIVPIICAMLCFSGIRGWRWLKAHNIARSF